MVTVGSIPNTVPTPAFAPAICVGKIVTIATRQFRIIGLPEMEGEPGIELASMPRPEDAFDIDCNDFKCEFMRLTYTDLANLVEVTDVSVQLRVG